MGRKRGFLLLAGLLLAVCVSALTTGHAERAGEPASLDPQDAALARTRAELSPDRRWMAVECWIPDGRASSVFLVSLEREALRTLEGRDSTLAPLAWSADGLVRVRRLGGGAHVRWIEPRSAATVKATPDRNWQQQGLAEPAGDGWSNTSIVRAADGRSVMRVAWPERRLYRDFDDDGRVCVATAREPGLSFVGRRGADGYTIARVELAQDGEREIARCESTDVIWTVSADARSLAVRQGGEVRVLSADDGSRRAGPWRAGWAHWVQTAEDASRWLLFERGGAVVLADLERDRELELGRDDKAFRIDVRIVDDERIVVLDADAATLIDAEGKPLRRLFPPASAD